MTGREAPAEPGAERGRSGARAGRVSGWAALARMVRQVAPVGRVRRWVAPAAAALVLSAAGAALTVAAARGPAPPRTEQDRVQAIASTLRCPVCQNLSVADSPSRLAREMRASIDRRLREGRTPEQIREEFVRAYGEWILLEPPRRGIGLVAWVLPGLLLAGGMGAAAVAVRRWTGEAPRGPAMVPGGEADGGVPGGEAGSRELSAAEREALLRALAGGGDGEPE